MKIKVNCANGFAQASFFFFLWTKLVKTTQQKLGTNKRALSDNFIKQFQGISVHQPFTLKVCDLANVRRLISGLQGVVKGTKCQYTVSHLLLSEHNVFLNYFKLCFSALCYLTKLCQISWSLSDHLNPGWSMDTDYFTALVRFLAKVSAEYITLL